MIYHVGNRLLYKQHNTYQGALFDLLSRKVEMQVARRVLNDVASGNFTRQECLSQTKCLIEVTISARGI